MAAVGSSSRFCALLGQLACLGLWNRAAGVALNSDGVPVTTMLGINYGVAPNDKELPPNDDFMGDQASPQWSISGRGDLVLIKKLGANTVRLYGNDPAMNHSRFMDEAFGLGLSVIPGNSDYPFVQSPEACRFHSDFDCFAQIRASYAQNLKRGFLAEDGTYHPAIGYIVAINEPDMKLPDVQHPMEFCKGVISGIDGMLQAEDEANVTGHLPNITVTFSWAICKDCGNYSSKPGLGQMWQLRDAMLNPSKYGYTPRHDLAKVYNTRFVHSFNTANPSFEVRPLFLNDYEVEFPTTPVFAGEYHWNEPRAHQLADVQNMLDIVASSPVLLGISYFEYMKREDGHKDFGIFTLGTQVVADMSYFGRDYDIHCLMPVHDSHGRSMPAQVARAFHGAVDTFNTTGCLTAAGEITVTSTTVTATTTTVSTTATATEAVAGSATKGAVQNATAEEAPCEVTGYYYKNDRVLEVQAIDWRSCQGLCAANLACHHFSFWPDGGCVLEGGNSSLIDSKASCGGVEGECAGNLVVSGPGVCGGGAAAAGAAAVPPPAAAAEVPPGVPVPAGAAAAADSTAKAGSGALPAEGAGVTAGTNSSNATGAAAGKTTSASGGIPWGWVIGGVAGTGVLGVAAVAGAGLYFRGAPKKGKKVKKAGKRAAKLHDSAGEPDPEAEQLLPEGGEASRSCEASFEVGAGTQPAAEAAGAGAGPVYYSTVPTTTAVAAPGYAPAYNVVYQMPAQYQQMPMQYLVQQPYTLMSPGA